MRENQTKHKLDPDKQRADLDQYFLIPVFAILLVISAVESRAETSALELPTQTTQIKAVGDQEAVPAKKLGLTLTLEYASNLRKNSSPDQDDSTSIVLEPAYKFSDKSNLAARIDLIQNYNSEKKTALSNAILVYTPTVIDISREIKFKPKISVVLPTDESQRYDESYQGSISLRPTIEISMAEIPKLTLANAVYINRNFHEFELKRNYSANSEYSIRNRLSASYQFTTSLGMALINDYVRSWTYNSYSKDSFYFAQELSYEFTKNWTATVSHMNEGAARGPNNNGENVEIFNQKNSYVSAGVSHAF